VQSLTDQVKEAEEAKERNRLTLRGIIDKKVELVHQLEAQIKELESKPQDVAVVDRTEEVNALKTEIESLRQQLSEKPDTQLSLGVEPIYQTDSKALFKPYLTAAADAVNRLAEFIAQHQSDANYDFFMEKMHAAFAFADQKIQAMKG
jgi:capsule polysaccharide export protein KpsE/RkpR